MTSSGPAMALSPVEQPHQEPTLDAQQRGGEQHIAAKVVTLCAHAPHERNERYIRRDERGRINESEDDSRSLSGRAQTGEGVSQPGHRDKGATASRKL